MHGNTKTAENSSLKTRHFDDIVYVSLSLSHPLSSRVSIVRTRRSPLSLLALRTQTSQEITRSMAIHAEQGSILGGVHLELTGEVNEDGFSVVRSPFPSLSPPSLSFSLPQT